jgi:hypothetical protein
MKRRFAPLIISLGLLVVFSAAAYLRAGPTPHDQATGPPSARGAAVLEDQAPTPAAVGTQPAAENAEPGAADSADQAVVKTGCGKPEPCPGRSCEDCPNNVLLR